MLLYWIGHLTFSIFVFFFDLFCIGSTSARKRIERLPTNPLQNGFNPTNIKIIDTPNITSTMAKPVTLRKFYYLLLLLLNVVSSFSAIHLLSLPLCIRDN